MGGVFDRNTQKEVSTDSCLCTELLVTTTAKFSASMEVIHGQAAQSVDCWAFGYTALPDTDVEASAVIGDASKFAASRFADSKLVNTPNCL